MIFLLWILGMVAFSAVYFVVPALIHFVSLGKLPYMEVSAAVTLGCMTGTAYAAAYYIFTNFKW